jgi:CheY-like chemotaxis protein
MDVNMPIMDGIDSAIKIKEYAKSKNFKEFTIIACTAFTDLKTKERCI